MSCIKLTSGWPCSSVYQANDRRCRRTFDTSLWRPFCYPFCMASSRYVSKQEMHDCVFRSLVLLQSRMNIITACSSRMFRQGVCMHTRTYHVHWQSRHGPAQSDSTMHYMYYSQKMITMASLEAASKLITCGGEVSEIHWHFPLSPLCLQNLLLQRFEEGGVKVSDVAGKWCLHVRCEYRERTTLCAYVCVCVLLWITHPSLHYVFLELR